VFILRRRSQNSLTALTAEKQDQLLAFNPESIVYVSCNVRTQAKDIGYVVSKSNANTDGKGYRIESARACDLFVNTHHAEGLAVLRRDV
jgi:tRNA (uracil-5-)-methyltransferase